MNELQLRRLCEKAFEKAGVHPESIEFRTYPEETIVVIYVPEDQFIAAVDVGNELDQELERNDFHGFVTVKKVKAGTASATKKLNDLLDPRISDVLNLLSSRSRASELNPSLEYIPNASDNLADASSSRHHIVFGRRGSGKTSLLAETNRIAKQSGDRTVWMNIQTYRHETAAQVFLAFAERVVETIQSTMSEHRRLPQILADAEKLIPKITTARNRLSSSKIGVHAVIPSVQRIVRRFTDTTGIRLIIFLDDFHYLARDQQPLLLDYLHGAVRDTDAWLKIATIEHLTRWFESSTSHGLQLGHDAVSIDLDLTLQRPSEAKVFLEKILSSYATVNGISSLNKFINPEALDRLVLASGAVPRDYLTLCGDSVRGARNRANAKQIGVQDVNKAAGEAKQRKIDELEDDAAAHLGESATILNTLEKIRNFCLEEKAWTYFRIDFNEKEKLLGEYSRLQMLVDLRLLHLVEDSLSDEHKAGHKAEVYMLDLSQYVGQRLKRKLSLLDLTGGKFALRQTGSGKASGSKVKATVRVATTSNQRLSILRRCPQLHLATLKVSPPKK